MTRRWRASANWPWAAAKPCGVSSTRPSAPGISASTWPGRPADLRSLGKRYQTAGENYLTVGQYERAVQPLLTSLEIFEAVATRPPRPRRCCGWPPSTGSPATIRKPSPRPRQDWDWPVATPTAKREGQLLIELGKIHAARNELTKARAVWQRAAALLASISPNDEADALKLLAEN